MKTKNKFIMNCVAFMLVGFISNGFAITCPSGAHDFGNGHCHAGAKPSPKSAIKLPPIGWP